MVNTYSQALQRAYNETITNNWSNTMSDTTAMILCCLVFALWGVLLALGV